MPATVTTLGTRRPGSYVTLEAALPGRPPRPIGVYLIDPATDRAFFRLRPSFDDIADPLDAEVLAALAGHIQTCTRESGAAAFLESLEDSASHAIRVSPRQAIEVIAFTQALDQLFSAHVDPIAIQPFQTHVPLFTLRAAAGALGEEMESLAEGWVPLPEAARPAPDLFAAHVVGASMEPRIPDGSLNLFRMNPQGSRQGKILLIERYGVLDDTARYTVKRYTSRKRATGEDQWVHEQIRLEPLNPAFEPWDVEPDGFAVVAEWLRVIE